MERNAFYEKQPQVLYSGNKALVLLNERKVEVDGRFGEEEPMAAMSEPRASYEYDSYWLDGVVEGDEQSVLTAAILAVTKEIDDHDVSSEVNGFYLNGRRVWLDKDTRVGLMNSTTIAKAMGNETTTVWFDGMRIEIDCDKAIQLLSALEMYALACFNVTAGHKEAVSQMTDISEVLTYDYRSGYPEKLNIDV